jgi:hypothetical protein
MDFLTGLEPIQWVFLGLGAVLVVPMLLEYGGKFLTQIKDRVPSPEDPNDTHRNGTDLTDLVCKWECLRDEVHAHGLHEACKKLDEVFPMLIQVRAEVEVENASDE